MSDILGTYDEFAVMSNEQSARYAMDSRLYVRFYLRPVLNNHQSALEGRPIYDEREYVNIIMPGDKNCVIDRPASTEDKARFEKQYDKFKKNAEQSTSGTPLEIWPQMTVGRVAELKGIHIRTVEDLAEIPDTVAAKLMGGYDLRRRAQAFLDAAKGEAANTQLASELEKRDSEILALKEQMGELLQKMNAAATKTVTAPAKVVVTAEMAKEK